VTAHLTRVRSRLALHAHRKVRGLLEGRHASAQTGRSTEFNDLREYVRGDDVADIDHRASARTGTLLVRRYAGERRHTVLLVVSTGRSMAALNTVETAKREVAATVAGVVGHVALQQGDRVGLVHGDADGCHQLPPGAGDVHLERCLATAYDATRCDGATTDLTGLLGHVARTVRRRCIVVVVTDEVVVDDELTRALRRLAAQHELLLVTVADLDPTDVPAGALADVDSGRTLPDWLADDPRVAQEYAARVATDARELAAVLSGLGIAHERVEDEATAVASVFRLLERQRRAQPR
jgi:uncharacterized protein (DUF58 family)